MPVDASGSSSAAIFGNKQNRCGDAGCAAPGSYSLVEITLQIRLQRAGWRRFEEPCAECCQSPARRRPAQLAEGADALVSVPPLRRSSQHSSGRSLRLMPGDTANQKDKVAVVLAVEHGLWSNSTQGLLGQAVVVAQDAEVAHWLGTPQVPLLGAFRIFALGRAVSDTSPRPPDPQRDLSSDTRQPSMRIMSGGTRCEMAAAASGSTSNELVFGESTELPASKRAEEPRESAWWLDRFRAVRQRILKVMRWEASTRIRALLIASPKRPPGGR